jgi:ABC transporter DrrB family efflux protein
VERAATDIGMPHIAERARRVRAGVPDQPEDERRAPPAGAEFRWDGTVWTLRYAGCTVHLPDAKGLRDLHVLLSRAGQDVTAVELLAPAGGELVVAARRLGADPVLDDEAKARYRRRLAQLDDEIDRAGERGDQRRAIEVDREREALLAELRAAAGLGGRTRRLGDEAERARKTVTARIRDTLRRLDEHHPELVAHLRARENRHRPGDRDVRAGQDVRPDPGGGRHRPRRTGWRGLRSARAQRGRQDHRDPDAGHPAAARRRRGPGVRPRRGPRRRRGTQPGQPDRPVRVGRALAGSAREYLQYLLPGIMVTSVVMITMYTGLGLNADIEKGVFDRFRSLPIWRPAALVGMILGDLLRYVLAATMILGVGLVLGFRPAGGVAGVLAGIGLLVVFSFAFSWIWTMFGLLLRSEKSVMGVSMLVLFPLTFLSNVFVDPTTMPGWLQAFVDVNPISPIWSPRCAA